MYNYLSDFKCPLCGAVVDPLQVNLAFHNPVFINKYPSVCVNQGANFKPVSEILSTSSLLEPISITVRRRLPNRPEEIIQQEIQQEMNKALGVC